MGEEIRVGLVGCGGMGREHLNILARVPGVRLVGVCDHREDRARRMGRDVEAPYWTDYTRFLEETGIQALHICSPTGLHADQGIVAAERGIHLLCEKPIDLNLAKTETLIAACDRHDVRLACVFQRRMSPGAQRVREAIATGQMGRLLSCSVSVKWWRSQAYYDKDDWRGTWELDGGVLANQAIHSLDQMVWMAGPVAEVEYAHLATESHTLPVEDFALVVVRFENGARGTIEATTCCHPDLATRLEIYGTNGSAAFDDARVVRFGLNGEDLLPTIEDTGHLHGGGSEPLAITLTGHEAQITDFYQAIREHRPPVVDGREARHSVELLTKIYAKAFPHQKREV